METQDTSAEFLFKLWPWLEANKVKLIAVAVAVVVFAGGYSILSWQHQQTEISAGQAFTQLIFPTAANSLNASQQATALVQLADKYSGTETALRAQLQAAKELFDSGDYAGAQAQFQKFTATTGPLAALAALGVAVSLEAQNKPDLATTAYQKVVAEFASSSAVLQANFALGRIADQQGKLSQAESYFEAAAHMGQAGGTIAQEAEERMYQIKAKLAATQKSPAATTAAVATNTVPVLK